VAGESLFEQVADDVGGVGNGEVEVFLTTRGIRRRLADTYQSQKRFNDARAVDIHGGFTAIMVNEVPVIADDDCPKGFAFGINKDSFKWFQQAGPGWLESKDGTVFQLQPGASLRHVQRRVAGVVQVVRLVREKGLSWRLPPPT
jgi:hypothetical protein